MPELCLYGMCQSLGSSTYLGYCNQEHMKRSVEREKLLKVLETNPQLSTIRDARKFLEAKTKEEKTQS